MNNPGVCSLDKNSRHGLSCSAPNFLSLAKSLKFVALRSNENRNKGHLNYV